MAKVILHFICVILVASCVQGCFFLDIKCKLNEYIQKVGSQLIGKAEQAFEQAMDHVFDEDISPLLDKAIAAIDAGIDKVDKDVNDTINHIEKSIETIINEAAQTANALASNVTHDIEEIIRNAASAMEEVENTFYRDASNLLTQINQIVQKGQCMEASGAKQIQDQIYKLLKSLDPYYRFSSCWRSLGYKITMSFEDLTDIQLYDYQKQCTLLNKITPDTPIHGPGGILETYAQGQLYAAEYYCIGETANAPAFQDLLSKEWLWWGVQYNTWKNIGDHKANQGKTVWKKMKDDPCGTPVECYAQAIKALQEAEQKMVSIQTGLSDLNHTVSTLQTGLGTVITNQKEADSSILEMKTNVSTNGRAIANLSSLTAYPCNCTSNTSSVVCPSSKSVSQGYPYYKEFNETISWFFPLREIYSRTPTAGPFGRTPTYGIRCCDLCVGTAQEAAAYALANPIPPAVKCPWCRSGQADLK